MNELIYRIYFFFSLLMNRGGLFCNSMYFLGGLLSFVFWFCFYGAIAVASLMVSGFPQTLHWWNFPLAVFAIGIAGFVVIHLKDPL